MTAALQDLTETMMQARRVDEYAGRENHEASLILRYLAPICYVLTVLGGIFYFRADAADVFSLSVSDADWTELVCDFTHAVRRRPFGVWFYQSRTAGFVKEA